jgi:hypothetical protein
MTTALLCGTPIQGRILRVIALNSCGVPVSGTATSGGAGGVAQIVMDGFTQVQQSPQYEDGSRKVTRKANGDVCVNELLEPSILTEIKETIDFCVTNPGLIVATLNARLLTASLSPTGTGFAVMQGVTAAHWSLEVWQSLSGDLACDPNTGAVLYAYNAWPHLWNAKFGDNTMGADPTMLQLIAQTKKASPLWTAGNPWLGNAPPQSSDHWLYNITSVAPPASACSLANYP